MNAAHGRASTWQLRTRTLAFGRLPLLMGIVNVTPDSFSDGGLYSAPERAIEHGLRLVEQGADLLDIGGESTRPYSDPVADAEQLRRVLPVVQALCEASSVPVSIDTSKCQVAREAIAAGAEIINDVTGLEGDPHMTSVALEAGVGICAMHMQGTPQTMQDNPTYRDVVADIQDYLSQRLGQLLAAGIARERICLDPGIGFGKTHEHNLELLKECYRFHKLGCPLLVGPSRKGFIAHVLGDKQTARDAGTAGVTLALALQGVQIIRVHDVQTVRQALLLFEASGGLEQRGIGF